MLFSLHFSNKHIKCIYIATFMRIVRNKKIIQSFIFVMKNIKVIYYKWLVIIFNWLNSKIEQKINISVISFQKTWLK
ncbi:hypothetical protein PH4a_14365 [Proteus hauseri]|nr:hypothetical protein PH4a_14365 [Proteus hauseri]